MLLIPLLSEGRGRARDLFGVKVLDDIEGLWRVCYLFGFLNQCDPLAGHRNALVIALFDWQSRRESGL